MQHRKAFSGIVGFLILMLVAGVFPLVLNGQKLPVRQQISIDTGWRFHLGHAADPSKDFNYSIANIYAKSGKAEDCAIGRKFDDSEWRKINLPHDWAVELPFVRSDNPDVVSHGFKPVGGLFPETSIGWYRKSFDLAASDSGRRFFVRFDGVFRDAKFWLNGFYLGTNESGYVGITWDITDYVDFHHPNVLVVRVDATQYEGWFYEGAGIYRHAWLVSTDNLHIAENGIFIQSGIKDGTGYILVETTLKNQYPFPDQPFSLTPPPVNRFDGTSPVEINAKIRDRDGKVVALTNLGPEAVSLHATKFIRRRLQIENPRLWSPDDPYLYRLSVTVKSGFGPVDSMTIRFGIRDIRVDADSGFFLNGKNMKLFGVNCHQDHAGVGAALPDYLQYYRIGLLKKMGVNAYRTSHHAPAPELLDACDSLGMLVLDEQRLLNSSPEYIDQFKRLLLRDRNHPSVFMWSIGNEEGYLQTNSFGKRIAQTFIQLQQQIDPTRPCTYAADLPNWFPGINEVIPVRSFNYRQFAVADYHKSHPDQPIVGTEMGSTVTTRGILEKDTVRCYLPDQDITAPWWASTAEEWWTLCAAQPWWMGGFIWTGLDYRGEPTPYSWPNINSHFGVMDMCGFPKNIYYYYQSWWSDKDVLHISPNWNHEGKEGDTVKVWVNSNADDVELLLNGKSLGTKRMPRNSHLIWKVPFEKGKLEAVALKNGRKLTATVETTGDPVEIVLEPSKPFMMRDGRDAMVVNVTVTDRKGREVPDAANLIRFSLTGDARIIGVGNGDPSSHEPDQCEDGYWQRKLFNGKCQVILQAGYKAGTVRFTASSDGLRPAATVVDVK